MAYKKPDPHSVTLCVSVDNIPDGKFLYPQTMDSQRTKTHLGNNMEDLLEQLFFNDSYLCVDGKKIKLDFNV